MLSRGGRLAVVGGLSSFGDVVGEKDRELDPLTFTWTQLVGPAVSLLGADSPTPSFQAPLENTLLTFQLVVHDGQVDSAPAQVNVTVQPVTTTPKLANISTRAKVLTGDDVMIGGFIISGSEPKQVLKVEARGSRPRIPFLRHGIGARLDDFEDALEEFFLGCGSGSFRWDAHLPKSPRAARIRSRASLQ